MALLTALLVAISNDIRTRYRELITKMVDAILAEERTLNDLLQEVGYPLTNGTSDFVHASLITKKIMDGLPQMNAIPQNPDPNADGQNPDIEQDPNQPEPPQQLDPGMDVPELSLDLEIASEPQNKVARKIALYRQSFRHMLDAIYSVLEVEQPCTSCFFSFWRLFGCLGGDWLKQNLAASSICHGLRRIICSGSLLWYTWSEASADKFDKISKLRTKCKEEEHYGRYGSQVNLSHARKCLLKKLHQNLDELKGKYEEALEFKRLRRFGRIIFAQGLHELSSDNNEKISFMNLHSSQYPECKLPDIIKMVCSRKQFHELDAFTELLDILTLTKYEHYSDREFFEEESRMENNRVINISSYERGREVLNKISIPTDDIYEEWCNELGVGNA